jgi:HEAT repeat protein
VVIRRSTAREVQQLIADLDRDGADADMRREAAVARLSVLGTRAVQPLLHRWRECQDPGLRLAILNALEAIPDSRNVEPIMEGLTSESADVRTAAVRAARQTLLLDSGTTLLDRLTALSIDAHASAPLRVLALEALAVLPGHTLAPLFERLRNDPAAVVRAHAAAATSAGEAPLDELKRAAEDGLPSESDRLFRAVVETGADAPLSILHRLVERLAESAEGRTKASRREWAAVRGAVHLVLARRASRVALYDLREAFTDGQDPPPLDFIAAIEILGDESCLEPLARAYVKAVGRGTRGQDQGWAKALARAFKAILAREARGRRRRTVTERLRSRLVDRAADGRTAAALAELLGPMD